MKSDQKGVTRMCLVGGAVMIVIAIGISSKNEVDAYSTKVQAELVRVPSYDVDAFCKKAAYTDDSIGIVIDNSGASSDITPGRRQEIMEQCIMQEQASFDSLKTAWPRAGNEAQTECLAKIIAPRWKFYTQLGMCLEEVSRARYAAEHPPYQAPAVTFKR